MFKPIGWEQVKEFACEAMDAEVEFVSEKSFGADASLFTVKFHDGFVDEVVVPHYDYSQAYCPSNVPGK